MLLFLLENHHPLLGGVETLFKHLTERLAAEGEEVIVITSLPDRSLPRREVLNGVTIVRVPVWNRYLFTFAAFFAMLPWARRCDHVHTTSYNAGLPAFLGAKLFGKPVYITFHEAWGKLWFELPWMGRLAKWGHYLFEQLLLRLPFDRFVAVSESTAAALRREGVAPQRVTVIHNGLDYEEFPPAPPSSSPPGAERPPGPAPFTYTYFGRLGISKGLDLLLPAAKLVREKLPDSRLQLIVPREPAPIWRRLQRYIREHGLAGYVVFRHALPFAELQAAVRASDCVVVPSYSEGFCFAAAETIALGTPLVHSGRGALPEVVSGKYLEMADLTAESLAAAILAGAQGQWREKPLRFFRLEDTVAGYLRLYGKVERGFSG